MIKHIHRTTDYYCPHCGSLQVLHEGEEYDVNTIDDIPTCMVTRECFICQKPLQHLQTIELSKAKPFGTASLWVDYTRYPESNK